MEPLFDADATRLQNVLTGACVRALRRQDSICIATSGGLDSSVLAAMITRLSDVPVQLVTVGVAGATDPQRARVLSQHLRIPLAEIVITRARLRDLLPRLVPLVGASVVDPERAAEWNVAPSTRFVSPLRVSWEAAIFAVAHEAGRFARRLVLGQGADEWLLGYSKYVELEESLRLAQVKEDRRVLLEEILPIEQRIAESAGVQMQYPFLDPQVRSVCEGMSWTHLVHEGVRKRVLREVARRVGLPTSVVEVPKTAAQYGSGIGALLKDLAGEAGLHQNEYLTGFLDQRSSGELHSLRT